VVDPLGRDGLFLYGAFPPHPGLGGLAHGGLVGTVIINNLADWPAVHGALSAAAVSLATVSGLHLAWSRLWRNLRVIEFHHGGEISYFLGWHWRKRRR
jgi:hypothetical protein